MKLCRVPNCPTTGQQSGLLKSTAISELLSIMQDYHKFISFITVKCYPPEQKKLTYIPTFTSSDGGQICMGSICCGVCVSIPNVAKVVCRLEKNHENIIQNKCLKNSSTYSKRDTKFN